MILICLNYKDSRKVSWPLHSLHFVCARQQRGFARTASRRSKRNSTPPSAGYVFQGFEPTTLRLRHRKPSIV